MGSSPFRSIFLPSLVSSGVAFALITLPLSVGNTVPSLPFLDRGSRAVVAPLDSSEKKVIRYIGAAILGSVGTGMITADVLRRMYQRRRLLETVPAPFDAPAPITEVSEQTESDESISQEPSLAASSTSLNGQSTAALAPGHTVVHFKGYTQDGRVDGLDLQPIALDSLMRLDAEEPYVDVPVLTFLDQVSPAHLDTGDAMVFGVRYQNKYYCLWRSTTDLHRVLGWARRLIRQHRDVIVTQNDQAQYSLWYVPPKYFR